MAPKCKLCDNVYNPGSKAPLSLPCGHSFCRECLRSHEEAIGSLRCPTCRKPNVGGKSDTLTVNYDLLSSIMISTVVPSAAASSAGTSAKSKQTVAIVIKDISDRPFRLTVPLSYTVSKMKEVLQAQYGVLPTSTRLLYLGQLLKDEKTLANYKLEEGNTIQMTKRYLGGGGGGRRRRRHMDNEESKEDEKDNNSSRSGGGKHECDSSRDDEEDVEVDETLYSRQLFVYGDTASRTMTTASVLICGLGGVGVEIAKNVILTGVREVLLYDQEVTTWADLASQFYLTEEDLGKNRAEACVSRLSELNPYVRVTTMDNEKTDNTTTSTERNRSTGITSTDDVTTTTTYPSSSDKAREVSQNAVHTYHTTDGSTDHHHNQHDHLLPGITADLIKRFNVVVLTECTLEEQVRVDCVCREVGVPLVVAGVNGLCGHVFCDFGSHFYVADPSDRDVASFPIMDITQEVEGVVILPPNTFHGLQDGDVITFTGVQGMEALNHTNHTVKVVDGRRLMIGSTVGLGKYEGGGAGKEVRQGKTFSHQSLSSALTRPTIISLDPGKPSQGPLLHLAFLALHRFRTKHGGLPRPWNHQDAEAFLKLCHELQRLGLSDDGVDVTRHGLGQDGGRMMQQELTPEHERLLRLFSYTSSGCVVGVTSVVGGVAAGEVVKACARRFSPLTQFLYFDSLECLPQEGLEELLDGMVGCEGSRYEGLVGVVGNGVVEVLRNLQVLVVGAGAVGCELIKCLAVMGVGSGQNGTITLTDPDLVERSNLSRQFLFRPWHVRQYKADVAAAGAQVINPELKVVPLRLLAGRDSGDVLNAVFYECQQAVMAAVDSAEARRHLDTWCRMAGVPMVEAGTHGTLGSVSVVVPNLTERYTTQEVTTTRTSAVSCTLRNFPSTAEHLVQWARYLLQEEFSLIPTLASHYVTGNLTPAQLEQEGRMVAAGVRGALSEKLECYEDCVRWAGQRLTYHHHTDILNLLQHFPRDLTTSEGHSFWSGVRRCPNPINLDPQDPLHLAYVHAAANLQARVYGLPGEQNRNRTFTILIRVAGQEVKRDAQDELPPPTSLILPSLAPIQLDKDDPLQLDYMVAAAKLRGVNYHIPTGDSLSLRGAAGRINPAVVTSSAVVAGLASLELLKVVQNHPHTYLYRTSEFNLALARYCFLPPEPATTYTYNGKIEWSDWDKFDLIESDLMTLRDFIEHFRHHHHLQLTMVACGNFSIYSFLLPQLEMERRMDMRVTTILRELIEKRAKEEKTELGDGKGGMKVGPILFLDICANDHEGKDVEVPFVRYVVEP
ncbi:hypothetical protein Pcinc_020748 [Petrolisthes cinctipes]|uniref:Uncharacterized protein n=1 Tax=Petrolisthes cinctipes TaxID=88211 RepID=A0AAE1FLT6_PETCI|nr:hypothetical protein Pcinc_020748 [Petrolisthes cinctipes]